MTTFYPGDLVAALPHSDQAVADLRALIEQHADLPLDRLALLAEHYYADVLLADQYDRHAGQPSGEAVGDYGCLGADQ